MALENSHFALLSAETQGAPHQNFTGQTPQLPLFCCPLVCEVKDLTEMQNAINFACVQLSLVGCGQLLYFNQNMQDVIFEKAL